MFPGQPSLMQGHGQPDELGDYPSQSSHPHHRPWSHAAVVPCVKEEPRVSEVSGFEKDGQLGVGFGFQPWHTV